MFANIIWMVFTSFYPDSTVYHVSLSSNLARSSQIPKMDSFVAGINRAYHTCDRIRWFKLLWLKKRCDMSGGFFGKTLLETFVSRCFFNAKRPNLIPLELVPKSGIFFSQLGLLSSIP